MANASPNPGCEVSADPLRVLRVAPFPSSVPIPLPRCKPLAPPFRAPFRARFCGPLPLSFPCPLLTSLLALGVERCPSA